MNIRNYLFALLSATLIAGCGGSNDDTPAPRASAGGTIDQVAQEGGFNALLAAVEKADLGTTLADPDASVTVFAPTDAAFTDLADDLGFDSATALVTALPAETLRNILTYHVLPSARSAADLSASATSSQNTLYSFEDQPSALAVESQDGVRITDAALTTATVTTSDVEASNGIIHASTRCSFRPAC